MKTLIKTQYCKSTQNNIGEHYVCVVPQTNNTFVYFGSDLINFGMVLQVTFGRGGGVSGLSCANLAQTGYVGKI